MLTFQGGVPSSDLTVRSTQRATSSSAAMSSDHLMGLYRAYLPTRLPAGHMAPKCLGAVSRTMSGKSKTKSR